MCDLRTVATIGMFNSQEIRVSLAVHDGFTLVDMRVFAVRRGGIGEPHPTPAGICIAQKSLPALIEALQAAEREASR